MIIDKISLPDDPTPLDAPPSYDDINPDLVRGTYADQKVSPTSPTSSSSNSHVQAAAVPRQKGKARSGWFDGFGLSRTAKEVKSTVHGIIRDVVKQPATAASLALLESCAEACKAHNLSFSSILQDPSIESHLPIYWAIVKRPPTDDVRLVMAILSYSAPLAQQTMSEIRLACLHMGDQTLFQSLWRSPEIAALSGSDEVLLGTSVTPDTVEVQELPGDDGAFAAHLQIIKFETRMKVSGQVALEFIARGRMWRVRFHIISEQEDHQTVGAWAVSLSILEHSPPTWIDSRLVIREPTNHHPTPSSSSSSPPSPQSSRPPPTAPRSNGVTISSIMDSITSLSIDPNHSRSPPTFRLKTQNEQLFPSKSERRRRRDKRNELTALFADSPMGLGLQYPDSSYYGTDGTLNATLEARLTKSDAECIIC